MALNKFESPIHEQILQSEVHYLDIGLEIHSVMTGSGRPFYTFLEGLCIPFLDYTREFATNFFD